MQRGLAPGVASGNGGSRGRFPEGGGEAQRPEVERSLSRAAELSPADWTLVAPVHPTRVISRGSIASERL